MVHKQLIASYISTVSTVPAAFPSDGLGVDSVCRACAEDMCFVNRSQVGFLAFQQPDSSAE